MIINLPQYAYVKPIIQRLYERNSDKSLEYLLSMLNTVIEVELIVICYYLASIIGMTPELAARIQVLREFYKYSDIIGIDNI